MTIKGKLRYDMINIFVLFFVIIIVGIVGFFKKKTVNGQKLVVFIVHSRSMHKTMVAILIPKKARENKCLALHIFIFYFIFGGPI